MRKKVIAGNWKMYKTLKTATDSVNEIVKEIGNHESVKAIICAPFPFLPSLVSETKGSTIEISAQNMHEEDEGAFTGEVSPVMLADIGVTYVIIGHSERRKYFNETDETINKKIHAAFKHGITPILCVGETIEEKESGRTKTVIKEQIKKALNGLTNEQIGSLMIAYEPIWAIGTGITPTSEEANRVCMDIRSLIRELATKETSENILLLYGGSVNPSNIDSFVSESDIDGALVGGASLEADSFIQLVRKGLA